MNGKENTLRRSGGFSEGKGRIKGREEKGEANSLLSVLLCKIEGKGKHQKGREPSTIEGRGLYGNRNLGKWKFTTRIRKESGDRGGGKK